jgi:hypothetical protein
VVMPQIKDSKTLAAAGADKEDGRRPTIVSAPAGSTRQPKGYENPSLNSNAGCLKVVDTFRPG